MFLKKWCPYSKDTKMMMAEKKDPLNKQAICKIVTVQIQHFMNKDLP